MKKILYFVLIVCLPLIAFFEYQNYRRHHAPSAYGYETASDIDLNYHDAGVVKSYYETAVDMEGFGRYAWKEFGVDVLTDQPQAAQKRDLVSTYRQMKASLMQMEQTLRHSQKLKKNGFGNAAIKLMTERGWSEEQFKLFQILGEKPYLEVDDQGEHVFLVQKRLSDLGYELQVDGFFRIETESVVKEFQRKNGIYPSGKVDDLTGKKLLASQ